MSLTSEWPLPNKGIRFVTPKFLVREMAQHPLSCDLYPLAIGYYPKALGHHLKRLEHDSHLLFYCSEGAGSLAAEGKTWRIKAGDLCILAKGVEHEYRSSRNHPWSIYWVHYDGDQGTSYNGFINSKKPVIRLGPQPRLITEFENLFALRSSGYTKHDFIHAANQLKQMLTGIATLTRWNSNQQGQKLDMQRIKQLMQMRIDRDLELQSLAAEARLSKYHFSRKFKKLTGHSPIQYFIHLKMQFACQLLDGTTDSIKQIAGQLGFDDQYYFSRQFKQVIGLPPSQYRSSRQA